MKLRLFVAIDLDESARDFVAASIERLREAGIGARFEPREKWHVTLAFLGAVDATRYGEIVSALSRATANCAPFSITLDSIDAFPTAARPRVVWVGSRNPGSSFVACGAAVRTEYERLGFRFRDAAVVHVTVCRLKDNRSPLPVVAAPTPAKVSVDALTLYQSIPDGRTTRYAVREQVRFGSS